MSNPRTMAESWTSIVSYLAETHPSLAATLGPGHPTAAVAKLENELRRKLPTDLKQLLSLGSAPGPAGIIPDPMRLGRGSNHAFNLLDPSTSLDQWRGLTGLFDGGEFDDRNAAIHAGTGVVRLWWSPGWVPFADNGGGDSYCVDLTPTHPGTRGQVIFFSHESPERPVLAPSLRKFLDSLATAMLAGQYELSGTGSTGLVRTADEFFPDAGDT